jgi:hypothetical protein
MKHLKQTYAQISTHDDEEVIPDRNFGLEEAGILECLLCAVDRARTDYDKDAIIPA